MPCLRHTHVPKILGDFMRIAIASGKGGTGKTTVTVNLAAFLQKIGKRVTVVDCDVEEPNSHFFLTPGWDEPVTEYVPVPMVDHDRCLGEECRKCVEACRFKSLIWMAGEIMVFPELCHSCGLCNLVCPADAVGDDKREIGQLRHGKVKGIDFFGGLLRIGEAMAPPLIGRVKEEADKADHDVQLIDAPPGASCPVIGAMQGADRVVLVTEPTPFGLHDLELAVGLVRKLGFPFGVVINRAGMGDMRVERYLERENIPLLASFPHSIEGASAYSRGDLLIDALPGFKDEYEKLWRNITTLNNGGVHA